MTLPDASLDRPGGEDQGVRDRLPPNERNQDQLRGETTHGLTIGGSRPLTAEEKAAAEHDTPLAERVYAPASERVPVDPVPGHREVLEHVDQATPERQANQHDGTPVSSEPSFTRVERPSTAQPNQPWTPSPMSTPYSSPQSNPTFNTSPRSSRPGWLGLPFGIGSVLVVAAGGFGAWMFMRWQQERNKPINRIRRQAYATALQLRDRAPRTDELRDQPAGLGLAALVPIGLVVWRQMQAQRARRIEIESMADTDWHHRLSQLKERWSPRRLELEKFSISRH
jgi:hypothetical protein